MFSPPRPTMRRFVQYEEDGRPVLQEEELLLHSLGEVGLTFHSEDVSPPLGTLFVTSRRFIWISEQACYDFDVPYIALHAISNDPESYPKPCLYCQFDQEEDENENDDEPTEVFFVPTDESKVQSMFDIFSEAALNNPDMFDEEEELEAGGSGGMFADGFIYNVDEVNSGAEQAKLEQWESVFQVTEENGHGGGERENGRVNDKGDESNDQK